MKKALKIILGSLLILGTFMGDGHGFTSVGGSQGWGYNIWGVLAYGFGIWLIGSEIIEKKS